MISETSDCPLILFVEDNPDHAELVKRSFEDHPVKNRIHHVADGEAALDYLYRRGSYADPETSPRPNLMLLDLRLPKVDGLEVLSSIRNHREDLDPDGSFHKELQRIPVVILSTSQAEPDVTRAYQLHANSYLVKPLDFSDFSKMMDDLGLYWLSWNHIARLP